MAQVYTQNLLKNFKLNLLNVNDVIKQPGQYDYSWTTDNSDDYNQYYFQILIFEGTEDDSKPKLVYGTKQELVDKYSLGNSSLPTEGAKVDKNFLSKKPKEAVKVHTVRFLLQSRRLSQIIASTWLEPDQIPPGQKNQIKLIRKILNSYNIIPETKFLKNGQVYNNKTDQELESELWSIRNIDPKLLNYIIMPDHISYNSISLVLLLSGQAYYQDRDNRWMKISNSIFSTYEMIWEYGLDLSWDTFYATRIDVSQAGAKPKPPFTKVTLGYPPKPDEFNLTQVQIGKWVNAREHSDQSEYPFYPDKHSSEWDNSELKYIVPPYPYIPLSCM